MSGVLDWDDVRPLELFEISNHSGKSWICMRSADGVAYCDIEVEYDDGWTWTASAGQTSFGSNYNGTMVMGSFELVAIHGIPDGARTPRALKEKVENEEGN